MATDDTIRASDVDREVVVGALRDAYTAGRLTLDEFDERVTAAYAGRTWGDLRGLTVDLPTQPVLGADVPGREQPGPAGPPAIPLGQETELEDEMQPPDMRRRRHPLGVLIPLAVWILLVAHGTIAPGLVFLFIVVCVLVSVAASIRRR
jgi:Domain of unknown function (DUF1707)